MTEILSLLGEGLLARPTRRPARRWKVWPVASGKGQLGTVRRCCFLLCPSCADIDPLRRKRFFLSPSKKKHLVRCWLKLWRASKRAGTHKGNLLRRTCCLNVTFLLGSTTCRCVFVWNVQPCVKPGFTLVVSPKIYDFFFLFSWRR